jgi:hypothetical protein
MPAKLPAKIRDRVIPAFRETKSAAAVAESLGIGHTTVLRILAEAGIERGTPTQVHPHRLKPEQEREVVRRYKAGEFSGSIARDMKCSRGLVRTIARRAGCIINGRGNRVRDFSPEQVEEMSRRWRNGDSQTAIAVDMGVSQACVSMHLRRAGFKKETRRQVGERHGSWKGGRVVVDGGYVWVHAMHAGPYASMANGSGYVPEHRLVMARHLGRPLVAGENVHHLNGKRDDNRLENLELWHTKQPKGVRGAVPHCPTCSCAKHGGSK